MALKRARSPTLGDEPSDDLSTARASKFQRTEETNAGAADADIIWCKLPPTCAHPNPATACHGVKELESHYAQFHAFVCQAEGCSCVFDREHYLNLVRSIRQLRLPLTK